MIKYRDIAIYELSLNSINDLREYLNPDNHNCEISACTESDIKPDKDATEIYLNVPNAWHASCLDTKIIARVAKAVISLN